MCWKLLEEDPELFSSERQEKNTSWWQSNQYREPCNYEEIDRQGQSSQTHPEDEHIFFLNKYLTSIRANLTKLTQKLLIPSEYSERRRVRSPLRWFRLQCCILKVHSVRRLLFGLKWVIAIWYVSLKLFCSVRIWPFSKHMQYAISFMYAFPPI